MPALPDVAGVIKVTLNLQVQSDSRCESRFFVHYAGTAPTPAQLTTFCGSVATAYGANLKALASANTTLLSVDAVDLSTTSSAVASGGTAQIGTLAGAQLPGSACVAIQHVIARRYRGGKPKIFLPFGTASSIGTAQTWASAFIANVATGWNAFMTAVIAAGWAGSGLIYQCNVSYYDGFSVAIDPVTGRARNVPILRGTPLVDPVTGATIRVQIASQRGRNRA